MQPISAIGTPSPIAHVTHGARPSTAAQRPTVAFKDLLADALSQSRAATRTEPATMATIENVQAALSEAGKFRDAVIGAYHEIIDLTI